MELPQTQYERELEKLIQQVLLPDYLKLCEKYEEPFPWGKIPAHLVAGIKKPKQVARLLQAEFCIWPPTAERQEKTQIR